MATGDDALAAGMDVLDPSTDLVKDGAEEENKTRDYIAQRTSAITPIAKGGTGAETPAAARTNLGIPLIAGGDSSAPNALPRYNGSNQLTTADPTLGGHAASKQYVDAGVASAAGAAAGKLDAAGGTISGSLVVGGSLFTPSNSPGGAGTIAYVQNSDGRITRGVSARRYKKNIRVLDPLGLGDIFRPLVDYEMKVAYDRSGRRLIGHIADDMVGTPAERFVTRDNAGEVDAFDVIQLLLAQCAQLNARLIVLEGRDA